MSLTDLWLSKFRTFVKTVVQQGSPVLTLDQIQKLAGYCIWVFMVLDVPLVTMSGVLTHLSVMTSPGAPSSARLPVAAARDTNTMLRLATSSRPLVKQRPKLHSDTLWTDSCSDGAASLWELQGPSGVRRWRWSHSALRAHINVKELSCLLWSLVRSGAACLCLQVGDRLRSGLLSGEEFVRTLATAGIPPQADTGLL